MSEPGVGAIPGEMLLGIATILAFGAVSPPAVAPSAKDVVKARIKLIELFCSADAKSLVNTSPTEKAAAAKRTPCQARGIGILSRGAQAAPH